MENMLKNTCTGKEESTQLFPPSLILDGILRVTEKNTLARNGDNSAWGKIFKYYLIILLHTLSFPMRNARGENMLSRAFHPSSP